MYRRQFVSPLLSKRPLTQDDDSTKEQSLEKKARLNGLQLSNASKSNVESLRTPLLNLQVPNYSPIPRTQHPGAYFNVLWRNQTTKKNKTWDGDGILSLEEGYLMLRDSDGKKIGSKPWTTAAPSVGDFLKIGSKDVEIDAVLAKEDFLSGKSFLSTNTKPATSKSSSTFAPPASVATIPQLHTALTKPKSNAPRHDPRAPDAIVLPLPPVPKGTTPIDVVIDPILVKHLRPHQKEGVRFLYECVMGIKEFNGRGAILADEMGLGKTLTVIALIWTLLKQSPFPGESAVIKRVLVVCPVTLIVNWKKEFRKWLGNERIGVLAIDSQTDLRTLCNATSRTYQILLLNYERMSKLHTQLLSLNIDLIICDEGHRLKSPTNKAAKLLKSLPTPRRILLTGTPIQNDLGEFFTMVDFVNPGLLETYQVFRKVYESPIVRSRQPNAGKKDVELGRARSEALSQLTGMFVLRRTSEILAKYLPMKYEYVVFCSPSGLQKKVYRALLESAAFQKCLYHGDMNAHLKAITVMRKICNSVSLTATKAEQEPNDPLYSSMKAVLPTNARHIPIKMDSGKLHVLNNLLDSILPTGEKIVIVSNFTKTLDILQSLLQSNSMTFSRLDGDTGPSKRQQIVDYFNRVDSKTSCISSPHLPFGYICEMLMTVAFLLSSKSGGCGLNLIGASRLVLYDVDWNPSTDLQAMARIHRDGQKRKTYIYRFLITGMMDEKIYQRQLTKQALADSFMDGKGSSGNSFTMEELKNLFSYREINCDTHDLLDCPCDGNGILVDRELLSDELESSENETGFTLASQLKDDSKKKYKFDALHEFWHFDPYGWKARDNDEEFLCDIVEDDLLRSIVEKNLDNGKEGGIAYLFGMKTG